MSSIFYQRESKIYLFSFLWIYNDLYVITSHKSISLNFLMEKYFWTLYWPIKFKSTCSLVLLFQSFSNFVFNLIQTQWKTPWFQIEIYVKIESTFLCFCEKLSHFKLDIFSSTFLVLNYHVFGLQIFINIGKKIILLCLVWNCLGNSNFNILLFFKIYSNATNENMSLTLIQ